MANILIILAVAAVGILIVYYSLALFTKHGRSTTVPSVENMSYTQAVQILHDRGLRVDIRDSVYNEDVTPGFVMEQFPKSGSTVKPGRKIFLYINAVHPKEVVLDNINRPSEYALKGLSSRIAQSRLQELGFKNVRVVSVIGPDDRVVKVLANGRIVKRMQKVPINARIVLEVSDGRLSAISDSLMGITEYSDQNYYESEYPDYGEGEGNSEYYDPSVPSSEPSSPEQPDEEPEYEFSE